jgi:hypothetical protein
VTGLGSLAKPPSELLAELERLQAVERQLLQLRDQLCAVVEGLDVARH